MGEKTSFPCRKYDKKTHPYIVKQILEDHQMIEMIKEVSPSVHFSPPWGLED